MLNGIDISSKSGLGKISFSSFKFIFLFYFICFARGIAKCRFVVFEEHEIYVIKYFHICIFSFTFMLFCDWIINNLYFIGDKSFTW